MLFLRSAKFLVFSLVVISSNAFFALWKDGGARPEGYSNYAEYTGPLTLVPYVWALMSLILCFFVVKKSLVKNSFSAVKGIGPFLVYLLVSLLWSEDWVEAAKVFVPMFSGTVLLLAVNLKFGYRVIVESVEAAFFVIVCFSFFYALAIPDYGVAQGVHDGLWQGVFSHKNNLGNFSLLSFVFFLVRWRLDGGMLRLAAIIASVALVFLSGSTASLMGIVVTAALLCFSWVVSRKCIERRSVLLMKWGVAGMIAVTFVIAIFSILLPDVQFLEKDSSYSGRDQIWLFFLVRFFESPITGFGLGQISMSNDALVDTISRQIGFVASSTHNGFIDALYSLGFIGVFLLFRIFVGLASNARGYYSFFVLWVGVLPVLFINSFESRLVSFNIFFFSLMIFSLWARGVRSQHKRSGWKVGSANEIVCKT